jgi:uridine kinase
MRPLFVVISGLPGSGKTTLGRELARALNLPLIDKDELFDARGTGDASWRRALSRESDQLLKSQALASPGAVLVSFWRVDGMPEDSGTLIDWINDLQAPIVHLRCRCPPRVAAERFAQRRRHQGHLDSTRPFADLLESIEAQSRLGPLPLEPSIDVDTTVALAVTALAAKIRAMTASDLDERRELLRSLAATIVSITRPHPVRVAIDGVDAAGKTTLADELAPLIEALGRPVIQASVYGFHNPAAVRRRLGVASPEGYFEDSFNYEALREVLLRPLGPGGSRVFKRAVFDFRVDAPVDVRPEQAAEEAILLLDGVFLLRPELRAHFDFSVFVRVDFDVTLARAERRDVDLFGSSEEVRRRYLERYIPGQRIYLTTVQPERWASIVVDNNDLRRPSIQQ